jgi:hypothetical protein
MDRVEQDDVAFLIAVPEKALADKVRDDRGYPLRSLTNAAEYLFDNLRIERSDFLQMSPDFFAEMAAAARSRKIGLCARLLRNMRVRR